MMFFSTLAGTKLSKTFSFFKGRKNAFAEQNGKGEYRPLKKGMGDADIKNHLEGKNSYGVYPIEPKDNTSWLTLIDIDISEDNLLKKLINAVLESG